MDADEVNQLITNEVDNISDKNRKQFVRRILKFERGNMDKENYEYKESYKNMIKEFVVEDED
jgi:hypothetical protein